MSLNDQKYKLTLNNIIIEARESDNFINATQMCKAGGKLIGHWHKLESTQRLIDTLRETLISENNTEQSGSENIIQNKEIILVDIKKGNSTLFSQGTWIHPRLATTLALWISPDFAIKVSEWIEEWKQYSEENKIRYNEAIRSLKPSKSKQLEKEIKQKLKIKLNAKDEIETPMGFIDLITNTSIIEIKIFNKWKHALGQILSYGELYPTKNKIIILFGNIDVSAIKMIQNIYSKYDIELQIYEE